MPLTDGYTYNEKFDNTIPPHWALDGHDYTGKRFDDPAIPSSYLKYLYMKMKKPTYKTAISLALVGRGETCLE